MAAKRRADVNTLTEGLTVDETYLVKSGSLRETRGGKNYIAADLSDATGSITARMWDARPEQAAAWRAGSYVRVRGFVETYQGALQMVINAFRPVEASEVDRCAFLPCSAQPRGELLKRLAKVRAEVKDKPLSALLAAYFDDEEFMVRFREWPAASEYHHAFIGGLLEHSVAMAESAAEMAERRPELDRDLLIAGALLHDVGKVRELSCGATFDYTDEGRLVGHIVLGCMETDRRMADIEGFPEETRRLVLHLLASHHGLREYGSPVQPATPEALALHHLDNLDAKVRAAADAPADGAAPLSNWSEFQRMLGGRIYRRKREQ